MNTYTVLPVYILWTIKVKSNIRHVGITLGGISICVWDILSQGLILASFSFGIILIKTKHRYHHDEQNIQNINIYN